MIEQIKAYKFSILIALAIVAALLIPSYAFSKISSPTGMDKIVHFGLFFIFTLVYIVEFKKEKHKFPGFQHGALIAFGFVIASELLQLFSRSRRFELLDVAAGILGSATVLAIFKLLSLKEKNR
ncbi:MAG: hypothetical protein FD137_248 [Spirochaetes bacterium]|nr:MAG: hypothetical protein FD137_248 [Spirochaetota bacterium]